MIVCCIYHRPREFGESSSEESSSSSSSDDSDSENDVPSKRRNEEHHHDLPNGGEPCARHAKSKRVIKRKRKPSPNAYERQSQHGKKKDDTVKSPKNGS